MCFSECHNDLRFVVLLLSSISQVSSLRISVFYIYPSVKSKYAVVLCDCEVWSSIRIPAVLEKCDVCTTILIPDVSYLGDALQM